MRPLQLALISVVVVVLIFAVYVLVAKPTLVLPTQTVALNDSTPLNAVLKQSSLNALQLQVRSDGTVTAAADGQQVATIDYTPQTLSNTFSLGHKFIPQEVSRQIRAAQLLLPGLAYSLLNNGLAAYYLLPVELNVQFVPS